MVTTYLLWTHFWDCSFSIDFLVRPSLRLQKHLGKVLRLEYENKNDMYTHKGTYVLYSLLLMIKQLNTQIKMNLFTISLLCKRCTIQGAELLFNVVCLSVRSSETVCFLWLSGFCFVWLFQSLRRVATFFPNSCK